MVWASFFPLEAPVREVVESSTLDWMAILLIRKNWSAAQTRATTAEETIKRSAVPL